MNKIKGKKIISELILVLSAFCFIGIIYYVNNKIITYRSNVLEDYNKLALLQKEKDTLDAYNKILLKDSKESLQIQKYILVDNRKDLLNLIDQIEKYATNNGLSDDSSPMSVSVEKREDASLTKYNGSDAVISIQVSGSDKSIDRFLDLLKSLPLISYIEKINVTFNNISGKNTANITFVIYQKNEDK
jgi:hypothetical protein